MGTNAALSSVSGFGALRRIGGSLEGEGSLDLSDNALLATVSGFGALQSTGGDLFVVDNPKLTTLPPFTALTTIGFDIFIDTNIALTAVSGFGALEDIVNDLLIANNALLVTISGFGVLEDIGNDLSIEDNAKLETLPTFDALTDIGNDLTVSGNAVFSSCCDLLRLVDGTVAVVGDSDISSNSAGCNSEADITNACLPVLTIAVDADIPGDVTTLTRIRGDLTIGGTIATFPDFAALAVVEGNLVIRGITTAGLTALAGIFPVLTEVQGDLLIQNNGVITTITGFATLSEVGGNVSIGGATVGDGNALLTDAPALSVLATIGGNLLIGNNAELTTVPVLSALTSLAGDFTVVDNAKLSSCCGFLSIVEDDVTPGGSTAISGNVVGCNSKT